MKLNPRASPTKKEVSSHQKRMATKATKKASRRAMTKAMKPN